jgi:chromosome segregation protein
MTIDNADRSAPSAVNDREILEISRRIEREAGSAYRINGRDVRARDVQILFADAATGARSPALVHQGKIGEIIQAKPEQRRRVLEDAAGVAGLHARRPDRRLEEAGAPGDPLPRSRRQSAQGRGDAVPSALARGQCRRGRSRAHP